MKLLMFQAQAFAFEPPSIDDTDEDPSQTTEVESLTTRHGDLVLVMLHAEAEDPPRAAQLQTKCAKNIKWLANKRSLRTVALHSFAHLSESKAPTDFAGGFIDDLAERLRGNGYTVVVTPFGHSLEWELRVFPEAIAKVFKSL